MVKVKMGMTALAGSKLIENKLKADEEFQKEVGFLLDCFRQDPQQARTFTKLRLAKEIKEDVLNQYEILREVEPNEIYKPVLAYYVFLFL